jgi:putative membrane protein
MNSDPFRSSLPLAVVVVAVALLAAFALGACFKLAAIEQLAVAAGACGILWWGARRGIAQFFLVLLSGPSLLVSLTCAFGAPYTGESPLRVNLVLGFWALIGLSLLLTGAVLTCYERGPARKRFGFALLVLFAIDWVLLGVNVVHFRDWLLENVLTVPFALLIALTHAWFRLSNISYSLIYVYMLLHIIGTHYTYSEVPFGYWIRDLLGASRNHYDRIVHFSFGLLIAYPMREIAVRIGSVRGFWGLYVPIEFVLAFSAIYEMIEWGIAAVFGGDLGVAYLGAQGDEFDAVKDMALAGVGATIAMGSVFAVLMSLCPAEFRREFRESLRVKKDSPLGEEALRRFRKRWPSADEADSETHPRAT